ncbi:probable E3 SUMO-protein ligase RNF212 [Phlebotomus argentipes]|uniref:probable E3 SUMO-protein ligase RNF212 n=1 Tax=Phlebotomus argentipes TaxID=94469 RepID=UPI002892E470|nr:probable E3 SUMO-protein ligase RNF212 [Phlebotomus argentipes]
MTTWIHCNLCYMYYCKETVFYLLNCSHIHCESCLKKLVINNSSECKFCKKPFKYRKISKDLDPAIRQRFDLEQHKKLGDVRENVKFAQLQSKLMTKASALKQMKAKNGKMAFLEQKLDQKIKEMTQYVAQREQRPQRSQMQTQRRENSFLSSEGSVRKEPLLIARSPILSGFFVNRPGSTCSSSEASSLPSHDSDFRVNKRHPQITRLSKLAAQSAEFYRR